MEPSQRLGRFSTTILIDSSAGCINGCCEGKVCHCEAAKRIFREASRDLAVAMMVLWLILAQVFPTLED